MFGRKLVASIGFAIAMAMAAPASAVTLLSDTHNYGRGNYDPIGSDTLQNGSVLVSTNSRNSFYDGFNFSGLTYQSVTSLTLTLAYSNVADVWWRAESWSVNLYTNAASPTGTQFRPINISGNSITMIATGTALSMIMDAGQLGFGFSQSGRGNHSFNLASAALVIDGTPAPTGVPLPATGLLLLFALTGPLALRSKRLRRLFFEY